jgi:hypothetical protein
MTHENVPSNPRSATDDDKEAGIPDMEGSTGIRTEAEELAVSEEIQEIAGSETPTSSDVGKQTLTKADLGYDVTKEGVPPDAEALETPQHPDDPSAYEETERNPGMAGSESK